MHATPITATIINVAITNWGFWKFLAESVDAKVIVMKIKYIIQYFLDLTNESVKFLNILSI